MVAYEHLGYRFVGTDDGRIMHYKDEQFLARLFSFKTITSSSATLKAKNKVHAITAEYSLLAASGYGGEIIIADIFNPEKRFSLFHSKVTVSALLFLSKTQLIACNVNGEVFRIDLRSHEAKKLTTIKTDINSITFIKEHNALLIGAKDNFFTLIDTLTWTLLEQKFLLQNHIIDDAKEFFKTLSKEKLSKAIAKAREDFTRKAQSGYLTKTKPYQERNAKTPKEDTKALKKLQNAYDDNDFTHCYELIDTYNLTNTTLCDFFEKHWKKIVVKSERSALNGDAKEVIKIFDELLFIKTRAQKIGDFLRLAFFSKLEQLIQKDQHNTAQNLIYSYIDIFGYDVEISKIISEFELKSHQKIAIFFHQKDRVSRLAWRGYFQR